MVNSVLDGYEAALCRNNGIPMGVCGAEAR